jgi:hypothetical protein
MLTSDQFIDAYLKRSGEKYGAPDRWLQYRTPYGFQMPGCKERIALPCSCGEEGCEGWAMVRNDPESIADHQGTYGPWPLS